MELYRYSLKKEDRVQTSNFDTLIKFKKNSTDLDGSPKNFLFTTPYCLYDTNEINNRLCITYFSQWRSKVSLRQGLIFYNNKDKNINLSEESEIFRTWPAFGRSGGIPEILVQTKDKIDLNNLEEIMNGGAVEQWHQDGVENYDLSLNIAKIIGFAVLANEGFVSPTGNNDENSVSGIIKGNSTMINLPHNNKYVTFSAGYEFRTFELYIKIWAAYWVDVKDQSTRYVRYESIDPIKILPCKYPDCLDCRELFLLFKHQEQLKKDNESENKLKRKYSEILDDSQSCAYLQIYDGVSKLIERINKISDSFLFTHSEHVALL